jgi:hypothetical protein
MHLKRYVVTVLFAHLFIRAKLYGLQSIRLKNQFRPLNEDEIAFLDAVGESTRAKETQLRQETSRQLDAFRRQQAEAEKAAAQNVAIGSPAEGEESWVTRKRKKSDQKGGVLGKIKLRKVSSTERKDGKDGQDEPTSTATSTPLDPPTTQAANVNSSTSISQGASSTAQMETDRKPSPPVKPALLRKPSGLDLAYYSSDSE